MRPAAVVVLALALVLAGCSGADQPTTAETTPAPTTTTEATETTTTAETTTPSTTATTRDGPDLGIDVQGGSLPFDPNVTYQRVERMLGTNVSPPGNVMVVPGLDAAGEASTTGRVYLDTEDEAVLAHEFAHSILLRAAREPPVGSPDQAFASKATVEGAAEYVEAAYARRHLDRPPSPVSRLPANPERAYYLGRYHFGYRYFEERVDDPAEVVAVHDNPPNTSEQVLHGHAPDEEPPRPLTVTVDRRHLSNDAAWGYAGRDRLGEIALRLTLRTRLAVPDAAAGADGWGNDRLVAFDRDGEPGFAWVVRWDDAANATEFAGTFRTYRNRSTKLYGPPADPAETPNEAFTRLTWRDSDASMEVRRVSPEVTVVVVGSESFVADASASGGNESVTVSVG